MTLEEWWDDNYEAKPTAPIFWEIWEASRLAEREACAKVCEEKANALGERADSCDDDEDAIELKARAWQMSVLAAELRQRSN